MNELSLFTGAGGGILGSKILGWKTCGYVEWEDYPQKVIAQRIKDGIFDEAPIFTDVREFVQSGAARAYRGFVDVVTGGFPCQPFSVSGKREASNDERDMWPATLDVIKAVRPGVVYLENVPGLLSATVDDESGRSIHYFGEILRDLAESGYDSRWCVLGARDIGAIHQRDRVWVLAFSQPENTDNTKKRKQAGREKEVHWEQGLPWGESIRGIEDLRVRPDIPHPSICRVDECPPDRSDRIEAIGNMQVPIAMATAYAILSSPVYGG